MKTNQFNYDFGIEGEHIRRGLKVFGRTNIEYDYDDSKIYAIHIESKIGAVPHYLQMDFDLDCKINGIYAACEQDLAEDNWIYTGLGGKTGNEV